MTTSTAREGQVRAAGIVVVVSYVLNGGPRPAWAKVHTRLLEAVSRLSYRSNAIASALRGVSTRRRLRPARCG